MNNTEQNIGKCSQHQFRDLLKCLAGPGCQKHGGVLNRIPSSPSGREGATAAVQEETVTSQRTCTSDRLRQASPGRGAHRSWSAPVPLHVRASAREPRAPVVFATVGNDSTSRAEKSSHLHTCVLTYTYAFVAGVLFILE